MASSISVEEFQRFQTQLLDLREAQIAANESRLRAETRVKQLETELTFTKAALGEATKSPINQNQLDELSRENKMLRDKLLSTESSFQLQSSTLRAECHRLTNQLDLLTNKQSNKSYHAIASQTSDTVVCFTSSVQTDPNSGNYTIEDIHKLEQSVELATTVHYRLCDLIDSMEARLSCLESQYESCVSNFVNKLRETTTERDCLQSELLICKKKIDSSDERDKELRDQIEVVKRRSEKVNRELRRQLGRLLRNKQIDIKSDSLSKTSLYSSSSSLTSNTVPNEQHLIPNGEVGNCSSVNTYGQDMNSSVISEAVTTTVSNKSCVGAPKDFFPLADFQAIISRMSQVQEENCALRRQNQSLHQDLATKTLLIQNGLTNYLTCPISVTEVQQCPVSHSRSSTTTTTTQTNTVSNSSHPFTGLSWFPFMRISGGQTHTQSQPTLSSVNLDTVNRLKLLCEQLMTQNLQLRQQLNWIKRQPSMQQQLEESDGVL